VSREDAISQIFFLSFFLIKRNKKSRLENRNRTSITASFPAISHPRLRNKHSVIKIKIQTILIIKTLSFDSAIAVYDCPGINIPKQGEWCNQFSRGCLRWWSGGNKSPYEKKGFVSR
jgi:hypothetical protein